MSTMTADPLPSRQSPSWGPGRALALACGSVLTLVALAFTVAGMALVLAHLTARDSAGFYTSPTERFSTDTYALTSEGMQIGHVRGHGAGWALDALDATVRVRASTPSGTPVFIGIAPKSDVDRYLQRSVHAVISGVHRAPFTYDSVRRGGATPPALPTTEAFWAASANGWGTQSVTWKPSGGRWAIVVMNEQGGRPLSADVSLGAKSGVVLPAGAVLFALGVLGLAASAALIFVAVRTPAGPGGAARPVSVAPPAAEAEEPYPLHFEGRLDEPLNRWLWLVKWLLALAVAGTPQARAEDRG